MKKFKFKIFVIIFLLVFLITIILIKNNSLSFNNKDDLNQLHSVEYSEEYKRWLNLSEDEKLKTIPPRMYDIKYSGTKNENSNGGLFRKLLKLFSVNENATASNVPSKFDLRNDNGKNYVTSIKNQEKTGVCWGFATLGALESNLLKKGFGTYDFSEVHLVYSTSSKMTQNNNVKGFPNIDFSSGGNFEMALSYLTNGSGAIEEQKEGNMKFKDESGDYQVLDISDVEKYKPITEVDNATFFATQSGYDENIANSVKKFIMENGGVTANIFGERYITESNYWNSEKSSYCYSGNEENINHVVVLVGWDDDYDKNNFSVVPSGNGAWIAKNSWGETFGDNGYFYISYYDKFVNKSINGIDDSTNKITYDKIYQYDDLGISNALVYDNTNKVYGANVFKKDSNNTEFINRISMFSFADINCKLFINPNNSDKSSSSLIEITDNVINAKKNDKGYLEIKPGYRSFKFDNPIPISGENFVIAIEIYSPDEDASPWISVEEEIPNVLQFQKTSYSAGESFASDVSFDSLSNDSWEDLSVYKANLCLKAFSIKTMDLSKCDIEDIKEQTYTGSEIKPNLNIKYNGLTLKQDKDYKVEYTNNLNSGKAKVTIKGIGSFIGEISKEFVINKNSITSDELDIKLENDKFKFTGNEIKPIVTIKDKNGKLLKENVDYELTYSNNIQIGNGKVIIKGIGNYLGTYTKEFIIYNEEKINNNNETENKVTNEALSKITSISNTVNETTSTSSTKNTNVNSNLATTSMATNIDTTTSNSVLPKTGKKSILITILVLILIIGILYVINKNYKDVR